VALTKKTGSADPVALPLDPPLIYEVPIYFTIRCLYPVQVKDSNHEVDRLRIASLVKKYVKMFKGLRLKGTNQDSDL
jgi:hypothetical protein